MRGQVGSRVPGRPGTRPPSCRMSAQPRNPESLPISLPFQCKDSPSLRFLPPATDRSSYSRTQPPTDVQCPAPFPLSANRRETRLSSTTLPSLQGNTKFSVIVGDPEREQRRQCPRRRSLQGSKRHQESLCESCILDLERRTSHCEAGSPAEVSIIFKRSTIKSWENEKGINLEFP